MPLLHIAFLPGDYSDFLGWIATTSLRASVFIILLLPLQAIFRHKIKARLHYLLWCLVFISLLLPWTPSSPLSVYNLGKSLPVFSSAPAAADQSLLRFQSLFQSHSQSQSQTRSPDSVIAGGSPSPADNQSSAAQTSQAPAYRGQLPEASPRPDASTGSPAAASGLASLLPGLIGWLWPAGVTVLALLSLLANRKFALSLKRCPAATPELLAAFEQARQELNSHGYTLPRHIEVIMTPAVKTPALFGLFRPKLLLPARFPQDLNPEQLRYIFMHELLHLKYNDIPVLWLARCLLIIHWFNPLVWYAFRRLRQEQELACDEAVLSRLGSKHADDYCLTLIALWEHVSCAPRLLNIPTLSGSDSCLKKRITRIRRLGKISRKWSVPALLLTAVLITVSLSSAVADPAAPLPHAKVPQINPAPLVNSTEPAIINQDLLQKAETWIEYNEFAVTADSDAASIALGRLRYFNSIQPQFHSYHPEVDYEKIYPTQPLFVKSYAIGFPDYYLVPFVQDGLFTARATVSVANKERTSVYYFGDSEIIYPFQDKILPVDAVMATDLVRAAKGPIEIPAPELVFHPDLTAPDQPDIKTERAAWKPAWEFILPDGSRLYVNQERQVLAKDVIPWYAKLAVPPYNPQNTVIEANTLRRDDGWSLVVEQIVLSGPYAFDPVLQSVQIYCRAENSAGQDQLFMPRGTIVSITSAAGQTYAIRPVALDSTYIEMQQMRLGQNETAIEAGLLKLGLLTEAEAVTTQFSQLTYRDENGQEFQIPLTLTPKVTQLQTPDNTLSADAYRVPGTDWGIALSRQEFRHGDWTDKKVAFVELAVINNEGPDRSFLPAGRITGIVGSSGKLYRDYGPSSFTEMYRGREAYFAEKGRPMYEPGVLKIALEILVDASEQGIAKVIYEDENAKKYEIPLPGVKK